MKQIKVLLWFDVEDYVTPESDDAFFSLLKMLDEVGVRATLKFCTEKVELLKERGREDIFRYLPNHELCFHTTKHSVHPLPTEYLEHYGFRAGVEEFYRREKPGFDRLSALVGQHLMSYGHPGVAWAPQTFAAVRGMGVPTYMDAHPILNVNGGPFWYDGIFTLSGLVNLVHSKHEPEQLEHMLHAFDTMDQSGEDVVFFSIYDHPTELVCEQFWDEVNFTDGKNPSFYTPAPLRAPGEMEKNIDALRRFIRETLSRENVEYITATQAMAYEKNSNQPLNAKAVADYLTAASGEACFGSVGGRMLCASELFSLLARVATDRAPVPELLYGPECDETSEIHQETFSLRELAEAAYSQFDTVMGYKQLKSLYRVGSSRISAVDLFCMLVRGMASGEDSVPYCKGRLAAADYVDENYQFGGNWILWDPEFRADNIIEQTKLQCWTLKPAIV